MSVENRLFRAYGRGYSRSFLIYILVTAVALGGVGCITGLVFVLPLEDKGFVWLAAFVSFILLTLVVTLVGAMVVIRRRANTLDDVFSPLGLEGKAYLQNGRQYRGTYRGYPVHIYFRRGPRLEIYLDVPLGVHLGIGCKDSIPRAAANISGKDALEVNDPEFSHLAVYPSHPRWADEFLKDPQTRAAILRLTNEETATEIRVFNIAPGALSWQAHYLPMNLITAENVRAWLGILHELARLAQTVPPPENPVQESGLTRTLRTDRHRPTLTVAAFTCGFFVLMAACIVIGVAALIFLSGG